MWNKIPEKTDVLMTHGPPLGRLVSVSNTRGSNVMSERLSLARNYNGHISPLSGYGDVVVRGHHVGCVELLHTVQERVKPQYHVFGHIHEGIHKVNIYIVMYW